MQTKPLARRTLATELVEELRSQIEAGALVPGNRIPTEKDLVNSYGVSRTVVREAVARLTAEGFLEPRQGSGVFVTMPPPAAFQVTHTELEDLVEVIRFLELRQAVEVEMAGLAALRRSDEDVAAMHACAAQIGREFAAGKSSTEADEELHALIAKASGNQYFVRFIEFLELRMVPRRNLVTDLNEAQRAAYFSAVDGEHVALIEAIARQDSEAARAAARQHLENARRQIEDFIARRQPAGEVRA
ncbi:MAG TPA: FadR/GntR family transcriptional regulator [Novosphingobium sp.]|nr:FadR/GntR family transcriptional regulator [Novosphingobium sp.]HZV09986.1 FadR/GntR family transcriptional regulator [Novosphingobium sp.]